MAKKASLRMAGLLLAACTAWQARAAVDPELLRWVPEQTRILGGIDIAALAGTAPGRLLFSALQSSYPRLALLSQIPGFDPLRDASEALFAATGEPNANHTLILLRGSFDADSMQSQGLRLESHQGAPVLSSSDKTKPWLALLAPNLAALGSPESIQRLLNAGGAGHGPEAALLEHARQLGQQFDFWMVSTASPANMAAGLPEGQLSGILKGDVMAAVTESALGVKLSPQIRLRAEAVTRTAKESAALAEVFRFFASVAQITQRRDPKTPPAKQPGLLDRVTVAVEGNRMSVSAVLTDSDLQSLLRHASDFGLVGGR